MMTNARRKPISDQDLILILIDNKPAFYGRVENIVSDVKPNWWQVKFVALTFPVKLLTWILDDNQIRGEEFTMGGIPIRIEKVVVPEETEPVPASQNAEGVDEKPGPQKQARVLSLNRESRNS